MQLIYIGIAFFLFKCGENMLDTTIRPHIIQIICQKQFSDNLTICSHLHQYQEAENSVQKEASLYLFLYRFASNVPSAITGLFLGAWSDKHGRRLPMVISCIGTVLAILIYIGSMQIKSSIFTVWGVLFGTLVQGSFGKNAVFTMAVNCFIAEESESENLTKHTGMVFSMNYFGQCLGAFLAGAITNSLVSYFTVIGIHIITVFAILIFVKEGKRSFGKHVSDCLKNKKSLEQHESNIRDVTILKKVEKDIKEHKIETNGICMNKEVIDEHSKQIKTNFVRLEALKSYFHVFTKERKNVKSSFLTLMFFLIFMNTCDSTGIIDVMLLYLTRQPFSWTTSLYSYYLALEFISTGVFLLLVMPVLSKKLNVSDFKLILVGLLCKTTRYIATGFCMESWMIFALIAVWSANSFMTCLRPILGKCVDQEELGKIYSLVSFTEIVSKLVGSVMYMSIYSATVSFDPRITFFVMGIVNIILLVVVFKFHKDFDRINAFEMTPIILEKLSTKSYTKDSNIRKTKRPEL